MAIAFVSHVGSGVQGSGTTIVITVPAAGAAAGNVLIVRAASSTSARTISSIVDSRSNTYAEIQTTNTTGNSGMLWRSLLGTALQSGDTITITFSAKSEYYAAIDEFSGLTTTEDQKGGAQGTSTTPSVAITPTHATDLIITTLFVESSSTFTEDADSDGGDTWHTLTVATDGSSNLRGSYKITTSAVTQTYNPTLGTSRAWTDVIAGLQAAADQVLGWDPGTAVLPIFPSRHAPVAPRVAPSNWVPTPAEIGGDYLLGQPKYPDRIPRNTILPSQQPYFTTGALPATFPLTHIGWTGWCPARVDRKTLPVADILFVATGAVPSTFILDHLGWQGRYPAAVDRLLVHASRQQAHTTGAVPSTFAPTHMGWHGWMPDRLDRKTLRAADTQAFATGSIPSTFAPTSMGWDVHYPERIVRLVLPTAQQLAQVTGAVPSTFSLGHVGWTGQYPAQIDRRTLPASAHPAVAFWPFPIPNVVGTIDAWAEMPAWIVRPSSTSALQSGLTEPPTVIPPTPGGALIEDHTAIGSPQSLGVTLQPTLGGQSW